MSLLAGVEVIRLAHQVIEATGHIRRRKSVRVVNPLPAGGLKTTISSQAHAKTWDFRVVRIPLEVLEQYIGED